MAASSCFLSSTFLAKGAEALFSRDEALLHQYSSSKYSRIASYSANGMCVRAKKSEAKPSEGAAEDSSRRKFLASLTAFSGTSLALSLLAPHEAAAVSASRRALREKRVPDEDFTVLPNGLKFYDFQVGKGALAVQGSRVAVHYDVKWKGITFATSRQGLGVTGGTPYGFDVGTSEYGIVLKGLDIGVEGMRVGGVRLLIVPPELAYGSGGIGEIPPNATIEISVELLSIKQNAFGTPVKLIEG